MKFPIDRKYFSFFLAVAVVLTILASMQYVESQQLRQEMIDSQNRSYYITNTSCGFNLEGRHEYTGCPETQKCFDLENGTNKCVKNPDSGFKQDYCGNHTDIGIRQSDPPSLDCGFKHSFEDEVIEWLEPISPVVLKIRSLLGAV